MVTSVPGMEGFLRRRDLPGFCWVRDFSGGAPFWDQTINSRFVSDVRKLGLDIKDNCDRMIIEKMVRDIMVERRDEFWHRANRMANLGEKAISEGGSSYCGDNVCWGVLGGEGFEDGVVSGDERGGGGQNPSSAIGDDEDEDEEFKFL
ncbi:unnamed protein product [Fraxinus pennsylvanica]|uniref:Uncharacterized protein n=1 Tax=Fraxinus pennsylvanica TaxID=56036 RepID=A0AAD2E3S2_9LAMI|nr:unnamed protein product [Fraxinus pennsylvanica]